MTARRDEMVLAGAFFWILALLVVPLPPTALDFMLSLSFSVSLLVLLVALSAERPLDFSVFPSLLLIVTLMRLGLNVASTRLILLRGADGSDAAGSYSADPAVSSERHSDEPAASSDSNDVTKR